MRTLSILWFYLLMIANLLLGLYIMYSLFTISFGVNVDKSILLLIMYFASMTIGWHAQSGFFRTLHDAKSHEEQMKKILEKEWKRVN